jgi:poly(A) polymerase/tRNA nucleotidyltransferase (CCA-adding enzyme)
MGSTMKERRLEQPAESAESKEEKTMEIPKPVMEASQQLEKENFQAYLAGGCVRDFLLDKKPADWDITTNAKPEEIQKIFPNSIYENQFGTVAVKTESEDPTTKIIEITTFRKEGKYTDKRHPDEITFAETLEEDLSRRDFTINAMAARCAGAKQCEIIDPFGGQKDLKEKTIRAVGNPDERFKEDALRLMRAVRLAARLGFEIEEKTAKAVKDNAGLIEFIAEERIAEELCKLLMAEKAAAGIQKLEETELLKYVLPELREGIGMEQNLHHLYAVFEHNLRSLEYAAQKNFPLDLRLAALLHDIGKSRTRKWENKAQGMKIREGKRGDWTFYGHQMVGARMALEILDRLHFPKKMTEKIVLLIREHMFTYDPDIVTLKGVRRLIRRVGLENIPDLFKVREADRIGSGSPKAWPYRLRHLEAMVEKVKHDPVSPKMLKITGHDVMEVLKIEPGPKIGQLLAILLEEVLDEPKINVKENLLKRIKELGELPENELGGLAEKAKKSAMEAQERIDEEIKKKYFVK